jgi:hypothetical protein
VTDILRVDAAALKGMRQSLDAVARNFDGLHEHREELEKAWGSHAIRAVMADFADNWTAHREKLRAHIEELGQDCEDTLQHFHLVDAALSAAIRPGPEGKP